jgi:hypothetical protein
MEPQNWTLVRFTQHQLIYWTDHGIGAAFGYVDDRFGKYYYTQIPGSTTKKLGVEFPRLYHIIPVTVTTTPCGARHRGPSVTLERWHLPKRQRR